MSRAGNGHCIPSGSLKKPLATTARQWIAITLRQCLKALAGGLMPRAVFEKLASVQLLDVRVPTTDGRELLLVRRTEPDRHVPLLLARLNLNLPPQPPPCISTPKAN